MLRKIFFDGVACDQEEQSLDRIVSGLRSRSGYLHELGIDEIIGFFDSLGKHWSSDPKIKKEIGVVVNHLTEFMSEGNLKQMADTALRNRLAMDGFVRLDGKRLYHAQPRGLAVHWLAGNVPVLGIFSLLQAFLAKNVSLVKASSRSYSDLVTLLESFGKVDTERVKGSDIARCVAVVLVDRDSEVNQEMSMAADIRIAWGGHEAVQSIMSLKKRFSTEDIIFGPKYSYAVIGKDTLGDYRKIAQRLAIDVSVFDQYACSSPHTVFVESGGPVTPLDFAKELASQLSLVNRALLPKAETGPGKVMEILNLRSRYYMTGEVFCPEGSEWTVLYSEEDGLAEACFSRVVFVRPIENPEKVREFNDRHKQTLGLSMPEERRLGFADRVTVNGVDRCPAIGEMTFFESPWDGMFSLDRMVRWVTCYG